MLEQFYPVFALLAMLLGVYGAYLTREIYYATQGSSEFWRFLSAFTGAIALYATFWFFSYILPVPQELVESMLWISLVATALYAMIASTYLRRLYEELVG